MPGTQEVWVMRWVNAWGRVPGRCPGLSWAAPLVLRNGLDRAEQLAL